MSTPSDPTPRWIAPIYKADTGEDFLGLKAVQANITDYLLPGIITITPRARYYSFYSWLFVEYVKEHPKGWSLEHFIRRREQIFALANLAYLRTTDEEVNLLGLTGRQKLSRHWNANHDARLIPLSIDKYVEAPAGGYDAYAGVMQSLEIVQSDADGFKVLPNGQTLARAFAKSISRTDYYRKRIKYDTASSIPRTVLVEYGEKCNLDALAKHADREPVLEVLLAFDAPWLSPAAEEDMPNLSNMRGTLGLILDMMGQSHEAFGEDEFRQAIAYGLCSDYKVYRPAKPLVPYLAHWQMFQLREYYVYALYAMWAYFLYWLQVSGPQTLDSLSRHLDEIDLREVAASVGISVAKKSIAKWGLQDWFDSLLDAAGIRGTSFSACCKVFAHRSRTCLNEHRVWQVLDEASPTHFPSSVSGAWLLLSILYLRLLGIKQLDSWNAWRWAEAGGIRRRALNHFVSDLSKRCSAEWSVGETLKWLHQDYIITQHTITALEKWRSPRRANTFHFSYQDGLFEGEHNDFNGRAFTASRFSQASRMLSDLGLLALPTDADPPRLTPIGRETLQRALETCGV